VKVIAAKAGYVKSPLGCGQHSLIAAQEEASPEARDVMLADLAQGHPLGLRDDLNWESGFAPWC